MSEIKVCSFCETSCPDEHQYEYSYGKFYYVCDRCWKIISMISKECCVSNEAIKVQHQEDEEPRVIIEDNLLKEIQEPIEEKKITKPKSKSKKR